MELDFTRDPGYQEFLKLKKQGIFGVAPVKFANMNYPVLAVHVETAIGDAQEVKPINWNVDIVSREGATMTFSDWEIAKNEAGQRVIRFIASMRLPDAVAKLVNGNVYLTDFFASSFADFNFCHGNEAFEPGYDPCVATKPDARLCFQDLGWLLPCRFADRLGEGLAKLNAFVMSGTLEDSIIYGIIRR